MLQLSYIGRSLPIGDEVKAHSSLVNHHRDLTKACKTDPVILDQVEAFAAVWAYAFLPEFEQPYTPHMGGGATLTSSRKKGGHEFDVLSSSITLATGKPVVKAD
jgi:hypothetical protein